MSRCFPYPPPGFVPKTTLIDSIELQKESKKHSKKDRNEKKKDKKEKKRKAESASDEILKTEDKKRKDKKRKRDEKSVAGQKDGNDLPSTGEGSGTTEEQGLPAVLYTLNSPKGSQDGNKRRQLDNINDGTVSLSQGIRIRLPFLKIKESNPSASSLDKQQSSPSIQKENPSLKLRQLQPVAADIRHRETPMPSGRKPEPQAQGPSYLETATQSRHFIPPGGLNGQSKLPTPISRSPQSPAITVRQPKHSSAEFLPDIIKLPEQIIKPSVRHTQQGLVAKHSEPRVPTIKQQNRSVIDAVRSEAPHNIVKHPKQTSVPAVKHSKPHNHAAKQQSHHHVLPSKQEKQSTQVAGDFPANPASDSPCFSGRIDHASRHEEFKIPIPTARFVEGHPTIDQPCFSGRTEAVPLPKQVKHSSHKPRETVGFCGSSSSRRKETKFRDLIENWVPPQLQTELPQDDMDWLCHSDSRHQDDSGTKCGTDRDHLLVGQSSLAKWPPLARHLPEADIYALPYVVPF